jgi:hypothetical protein
VATKNTAKPTAQVARTREQIIAEYPEMIFAIPEAAADDGSGIIAQALGASTWQALNEESESLPNAEDMIGVEQSIETLERRQSDLDSGLGWYLVVGATNVTTGEFVQWQTSSGSVMAKLVKLSQLSVLPATVKVYRVDKATKAGFYPLDLRVLDATEGGGRGY